MAYKTRMLRPQNQLEIQELIIFTTNQCNIRLPPPTIHIFHTSLKTQFCNIRVAIFLLLIKLNSEPRG
ncbi:hypothetical protein PRUPE_1G314200 [Prunus persica]|uniref:Uncharacterized protein n=1 Tax=Prunus persica TaxID=3760 RepID=A0A251R5Y9_PRUPE|nr:hypothetical protein PRUPE_1G314200 [Prunus persica]